MYVFIGGTGRCGTSLLQGCFGDLKHVLVFQEPRFLCDANGIIDYVSMRCGPETFATAFLTRYLGIMVKNFRKRTYGSNDAIHAEHLFRELYTEQFVSRLLATHIRGGDRVSEARGFISELFETGMRAAECRYWVEKTPHTARRCDVLYRIFPEMRYIHVFRDPLSVFGSVRKQSWGPSTAQEFTPWYTAIMEDALAARAAVPAEAYYAVDLATLGESPASMLNKVLSFAGVVVSPAEFSCCLKRIRPELTAAGRYEKDIAAADAEFINEHCLPIYARWKAIATNEDKPAPFSFS